MSRDAGIAGSRRRKVVPSRSLTDDGERIPVSAVVSNMDAVRTYRELVGGPPAAAFNEARRYEPACSGVVLYLGLTKPTIICCTMISSSPAIRRRSLTAIYRRGEPASDPTCYLAAPARTDPTRGAAGRGGALRAGPYAISAAGPGLAGNAPGLSPGHPGQADSHGGPARPGTRIVFEQALTPQDIHDRYRVLNGAIYGLASHGRFFGAFKPGNRSRHVGGLYLAGGAAHPGPGMPMVLMSGWIAADSLDQDVRSNAVGDRLIMAATGVLGGRRGGMVMTARSSLATWFMTAVSCVAMPGGIFMRCGFAGALPPADRPNVASIVYSNHPSWWDPVMFMLLQAPIVSAAGRVSGRWMRSSLRPLRRSGAYRRLQPRARHAREVPLGFSASSDARFCGRRILCCG